MIEIFVFDLATCVWTLVLAGRWESLPSESKHPYSISVELINDSVSEEETTG